MTARSPVLTADNAADCTMFGEVLAGLHLQRVVADKGYETVEMPCRGAGSRCHADNPEQTDKQGKSRDQAQDIRETARRRERLQQAQGFLADRLGVGQVRQRLAGLRPVHYRTVQHPKSGRPHSCLKLSIASEAPRLRLHSVPLAVVAMRNETHWGT